MESAQGKDAWLAGDAKQTKIFSKAVDQVAISEKARHSLILWGGIAAICATANALGTHGSFGSATNPMDAFGVLTMSGLGFVSPQLLFAWVRKSKADHLASESLDEIKAPTQNVITSFLSHLGAIKKRLEEGEDLDDSARLDSEFIAIQRLAKKRGEEVVVSKKRSGGPK